MSDLQNEWLQLQRAALLGTERSALPKSVVHGTLGIADIESQEHQLLMSLGLTDFYQQIGRKLTSANPAIQADSSDKHTATPELTNYINTMLDGRYRELLPPLLQHFADNAQTVPRELLPNLLNYGNKTPKQRHLVYQTIGLVGRQLSELNPLWHYATSNICEWERAQKLWRQPTPVKRQSLLRQLRHLNPTFARELLASSWKAEPQQQRLWFIRLLSVNLSLDDESFLEMALDDRMLSVRREAVKLLTMLPSSKLCRRMTSATRLVLTWSPAEQRLVVRFPVNVSRLLQRDGVLVRANPKNLARLRGEQLLAMVLAVPLDTWTQRFGVSAETILASLPESKWPRTLLKAFTEATLRQHNQVWALAILRYEVKGATAKLFGVLSAKDQANFLTALAARIPGDAVLKTDPMQLLLYQNNNAWTLTNAQIWLERVEAHLLKSATDDADTPHSKLRNPLFISTIRKMAHYAPIELADTIAATLLPFSAHSPWRSKLQDIIGMLRFRQRLLAAAAKLPSTP